MRRKEDEDGEEGVRSGGDEVNEEEKKERRGQGEVFRLAERKVRKLKGCRYSGRRRETGRKTSLKTREHK